MSLVKRNNSKFWYVQFQIDNQTFIRSTKTTDRRAAEKVASRIRAEVHAELVVGRKKPITLEKAFDRYLRSKSDLANHKNLVSSRRTLLRYIKGSTLLTSITASTLEHVRQRRLREGCLPQTVKHGMNCLMGAMKLARKDGFDCPILEAPTIKVANSMVRYLTVEEERRLLHELDPQRQANGLPHRIADLADRRKWMQDNYDLIVILLDTGARYSEIADLKWSQIDLPSQSIRLWRPKVHNESVIYMTDRVFDVISRRETIRRGVYLFANKRGKGRGYSAIAIRKAFRRAGLTDCTIHTLRHTMASRLIQNGLTVYEVKAVLGHTDIRTTMRYAHLEQTQVTSRARDVINRFHGAWSTSI